MGVAAMSIIERLWNRYQREKALYVLSPTMPNKRQMLRAYSRFYGKFTMEK
jgi:predicted alpha/beta hydrolase